jgi:hypothetical protein
MRTGSSKKEEEVTAMHAGKECKHTRARTNKDLPIFRLGKNKGGSSSIVSMCGEAI